MERLTSCLVALLCVSGQAAAALEPEQLFEKLSPSIWVVNVYDGEEVRKGSGSAVVIGQEELITNCHVLAKSKSFSVKRENTVHGARLIHADAERDLCVIRARGLKAPSVAIAPIKTVRVGQRVYAIGAPRGYELTFSDGLVSSLVRDETDEQVKRIQISVPISPGSSGGGLFDQAGRLIGVTSSGRTDAQNLNFAIPAEWIEDVPKRAEVALVEFRGKQKPKGNALIASRTGETVERQLTDDEFRNHFSNFGTVMGSTAFASSGLRMAFDQNGTYSMALTTEPESIFGSYQFRNGDSEICLRATTRMYSHLSQMRDCFRLFDQGNNKFILRSVTDTAFISYSRTQE